MRKVCVAPMMDWTDRHCRHFHRLLAPSAMLYTEMVTTGAILHGDRDRLLAFRDFEQPVALQLGGSDPADLAKCAKIAEELGYKEVNLNVGCPSDRVQKGRFGACLMLEPQLVKECLASMKDAVNIPVTIKSRLGVDDHYSYEYFRDFAGQVVESGCTVFIAHARKALLSGLSPKQNREVPPLHHDWVYRLKSEMPDLEIIINGGIDSIDSAKNQLKHVDGVMLGRAAYQNPWLLAECENAFGNKLPLPEREQIVQKLNQYLELLVSEGQPVKRITRHVLGLFQGQHGAKTWRRYISQNAFKDDSNTEIFNQALQAMGDVPVSTPEVAAGQVK
ncbi:MAG: tRNA-dihydrouridine synthase A [Lysobacterales bacterium]|jgi:tRNA-dihydrouridine synthase A